MGYLTLDATALFSQKLPVKEFLKSDIWVSDQPVLESDHFAERLQSAHPLRNSFDFSLSLTHHFGIHMISFTPTV